jgi:aminopeptidase N
MKSMLLVMCALITVTAVSQSPFPVRDKGEAPSHDFDVLHYRIEVAFSESTQTVFGRTTVTFVPFLPALKAIELDAEGLTVHSIVRGHTPLEFSVQPKQLIVTLDRTVSFNDTVALTIDYSARPRRGLYFIHADTTKKEAPSQIWSQGEDMDNHFWFPCVDFPNDFATSEVIATVRDSYQALSNGRLIGVTADKKAHTKTFHWKQEIPHASYLITLAAGNYVVLHDKAGRVPLEYWVYPWNTDDAKVCFASTPDMVSWFSSTIGYPYAWPKYAQVLIHDFIVGGMENTSATSLSDRSAVYGDRERVDHLPTSLIAHELAHQWWGDVVTCRDWRHLWLNESFASYFDPLWHEHAFGRDEFDYMMYTDQQQGIRSDARSGRKPIVSIGSYTANLYPRGASVLHMLRFVLGDQLFWRAINHYITTRQHTPVETNDFKRSIEEETGQNLAWFFDEWVYKAGYPIFDLSSTWSDSSKTLLLAVRQTQTMDSLTGVFRMPVEVELSMPEGNDIRRVEILTADTTFSFHVPSRPLGVVFDRGNWLLKEMNWQKSDAEWKYLAEHATNPIERIRAVEATGSMPEASEALALLARVARNDRFWAVRREAVNIMAKFDSLSIADSAVVIGTLADASKDPRPDVRTAAVLNLGKFRGETVRGTLLAALRDSSITTESSALRSLAKADSAHAGPLLLARINNPGENPTIIGAALGALGTVDSAEAYTLALKLGTRGAETAVRWPAFGLISRYGKKRQETRDFFLRVLDEPHSWLRGRAIRSLGDIGTERELEKLTAVASNDEDPDNRAARESADRIKKRLEAPPKE